MVSARSAANLAPEILHDRHTIGLSQYFAVASPRSTGCAGLFAPLRLPTRGNSPRSRVTVGVATLIRVAGRQAELLVLGAKDVAVEAIDPLAAAPVTLR